jgi:acyl-CoA synthetase (AMP-forming)/AMP-acid ligase II
MAAPGKVFRTELNPVDLLLPAAYIYPDKVALVHGERRYSYGQLAERSWQLANGLRSEGLEKGDAPEVVAKVVVKAANARSPKLRYTAGKVAGQVRFMRRFLPESFLDKAVRKFNKLPA